MKCPECDHDMIEGKCMYCGFVSDPAKKKLENPETGQPPDHGVPGDEKLAYQLKDLPESMRFMVTRAMGKEDSFISDDELVQLKIKEAIRQKDAQPDDEVFRELLSPARKRPRGKMPLLKQVLIVLVSAMAAILMIWFFGLKQN